MANLNLPPDAIAAIDRGELIEAIKRVREHTGLGLKESKDAVERYRNGDRSALASVAAASASASVVHPVDELFDTPVRPAASRVDLGGARNVMGDPMAEPGRVRGSVWSSPVLWLILLAVAVIAWRFFKAGV